MNWFITVALLLSALAGGAIEPPPPFRDKTISQLLTMLDHTNAAMRTDAAAAIAWHLERDRFTPNFIQAPVMRQTASKVSHLLQSDADQMVRLASLSVLSALSAWTNTVPLLLPAVTDQDCLVRVRAISVLQRVCRDRGQNLGTNVLGALLRCLEPTVEPAVLCEAAWTAGELGKDAQPTIPALDRLSAHPSKKVQRYAAEAIRKLRTVADRGTR